MAGLLSTWIGAIVALGLSSSFLRHESANPLIHRVGQVSPAQIPEIVPKPITPSAYAALSVQQLPADFLKLVATEELPAKVTLVPMAKRGVVLNPSIYIRFGGETRVVEKNPRAVHDIHAANGCERRVYIRNRNALIAKVDAVNRVKEPLRGASSFHATKRQQSHDARRPAVVLDANAYLNRVPGFCGGGGFCDEIGALQFCDAGMGRPGRYRSGYTGNERKTECPPQQSILLAGFSDSFFSSGQRVNSRIRHAPLLTEVGGVMILGIVAVGFVGGTLCWWRIPYGRGRFWLGLFLFALGLFAGWAYLERDTLSGCGPRTERACDYENR